MNNRLHNATNPYQGTAKKVLCVCSAGLLRSPTTAKVLAEEYGYNTRSCGADPSFALIPLDQVLVHWADEIVCMDEGQKLVVEGLLALLDEDKDVLVLNLPDRYGYNDPELVGLIKKYYNDYLTIYQQKVGGA